MAATKGLCALAVTCCVAVSHAEDRLQYFDFRVEEKQLGLALENFHQTTGLLVLYPHELATIGGVNPVVGNYTVNEALGILLFDTAYSGDVTRSEVIVVSKTREENQWEGQMKPNGTSRNIFATVSALALGAIGSNESGAQENTSDDADELIEEIVITGSRIPRSEFDAPTPMSVIDKQSLNLSGATNLADALFDSPAIGSTTTASSTSFSASNAGVNLLDLRRLGTERTLVLVDGRRHVGSSAGNTSVDINAIPTALVKKVEVITGGASAIYGADAVTGVVNIILDHDFEGLRFDLQTGTSTEGDAEEYSASLTGGASMADGRGRAIVNLSYSRTEDIAGVDRDFRVQAPRYLSNPANTGPDDGIPDNILVDNTNFNFLNTTGYLRLPADPDTLTRIFPAVPGGEVATSPFEFTPSGELVAFDIGQAFGGRSVGGSGLQVIEDAQLLVPTERFLISGMFDFELTPGVNMFFDGKYSRTEAESTNQPDFDINLPISAENPFLPTALTDILAGDPGDPADDITTFNMHRFNRDFGRRGTIANRDLFRIVSGLNGQILDDLRWDVFYQYGRSDVDTTRKNIRLIEQHLQAVDAIRDPGTNEIVCRDVAARAAGCIPLNIFGSGLVSQDAIDYFMVNPVSKIALEQQVAGATIAGDIFEMPAGPAGFAAGLEYRKEVSSFRPADVFQFTRITGDAVDGDYNVREVFGEVRVPLLADKPLADLVVAEAAVRFSDYSSVGSATTWKLGMDWAVTPDFRLRSTYSRAVRAPNIDELFSPGGTSFPFLTDPCDTSQQNSGSPTRAANCAALGIGPGFVSDANNITTRVTTRGNPGLEAEEADTLTLGTVYKPEGIPGLILSVDYWDIDLGGAISTFNAQTILQNCVDLGSTSNSFCSSVNRDADGQIVEVFVQEINVAGFEAAGVDFQVRYGFEIDSLPLFGDAPGNIELSLVGTYLDKLNFVPIEDKPEDVLREADELGDPDWLVNLRASYFSGPFTISAHARYFSETQFDNEASAEAFSPNTIESKLYTDLQARYAVRDGFEFFVGIDNVFGVEPPEAARVPEFQLTGTDVWLYDVRGTYFYGGVTLGLGQ